ncbi:MAG: glutamate-5-semialdehyde dehydrogenase [Alphaproteobacteria bacterium]|nr:glutamate-5-semialdehyde dehydrogenase [Alphaproteobacteria bacterium]
MSPSSNIIQELGFEAKQASFQLSQASEKNVNTILRNIADKIDASVEDILKANQKDVEAAKVKGLTDAMIDRLVLNEERLAAIANGVIAISELADPVGRILSETKRPNDLTIKKVAVPIGVLGMIYESRPNVTVDAAALCLKSRNAVILRGGSESFHSSHAFHGLIQQALEENDLSKACVQMVPSTDRALVGDMLSANDVIDVMIPRGGKGLTGRVMDEAKMPVFAHLDGNCHIYIDEDADIEKAKQVLLNAKLRRTGICGAAESLLLHSSLSDSDVKDLLSALMNNDCVIVGDERAQTLDKNITAASEEDWSTEYLEAKISCKFVASTSEAIAHINQYGSHHTDCIITENADTATTFLNNVDSAIVMHNASTQFADGWEFGMGAEIGIGTGKLHARGPVGLEQLTTFKYQVFGNGQTRA